MPPSENATVTGIAQVMCQKTLGFIQHAAVRIAMSHAMSHGVIVVVSIVRLLFANAESMSQLGLLVVAQVASIEHLSG